MAALVSDLSIKLFVCGLVVHWVLDWLAQNDWMAQNKSSLLHPASSIHSGIHLIGLLLIFYPVWWMAALVTLSHLLIDTRVPLQWWRKFYGQTTTGEVALHVQIWTDQALHITVLAIAALIVGGMK